QFDRTVGIRRDLERVTVVVVLLEEAHVASLRAVHGDLLGAQNRRGPKCAGEPREDGEQAPHARLSLLGRAFKTPSKIPLRNCEDRGVEKRLAISSASSMTTGRGVAGSCNSSNSASRKMLRSTTGMRTSRQWSACLEMIASIASRCSS